MNEVVFYKPETTGFIKHGAPSDDPDQPHICQLSALKFDVDTGKLLDSLTIKAIKPDGWDIPEGAAKIHGLTTDQAIQSDVSESDAIAEFITFAGDCKLAAFGSGFNKRVIRIATKRFCSEEVQEHWNDPGRHVCVQQEVKPVMDQRGFNGKVSMASAFEFFTGMALQPPFNAQTNVEACMEVYFSVNPVDAEKP